MIKLIKGEDFTEDKSDFLIFPSTTDGSMSKGIAKQMAAKYPDLAEKYLLYCKSGGMHEGHYYQYYLPTVTKTNRNQMALIMGTKRADNRKTSFDIVNECIKGTLYFFRNYSGGGSYAITPLGCGDDGHLDWQEVQFNMREKFDKYVPGREIRLYEPC